MLDFLSITIHYPLVWSSSATVTATFGPSTMLKSVYQQQEKESRGAALAE